MTNVESSYINAEIFQSPLLSTLIKIMTVLGILITSSKENWWPLVRCVALIAGLSFGYILFLLKLFTVQEDLSAESKEWLLSTLFLLITSVGFNACLQRRRITKIVIYMHEDLKVLSNSDQSKVAEFTHNFQISLKFLFCTGPLPAVLITSFDLCIIILRYSNVLQVHTLPLLMPELYPFAKISSNPFIVKVMPYYLIFAGSTLAAMWQCFAQLLFRYVILKIQILKARLAKMDITEALPSQSSEVFDGKLEEKDVVFWRAELCKLLVKEQLEIQWFTKELEKLLQCPLLLDAIIILLIICFSLYALSSVSMAVNFSVKAVVVVILLGSLQQLWFYHHHATLIADEYDQLCFAIYTTEWYNFPKDLKQVLYFMMINCTKPFYMKAFFVRLHLNTFLGLLRLAYSFFNFLQGVE